MDTIKEDKALERLRGLVSQAFAAGFDTLCLLCSTGFSGETCPNCWPPSAERIDQALRDMPYVREMTPVHIYAWISSRIPMAKDTATVEKLFALRDKLSEVVRGPVEK